MGIEHDYGASIYFPSLPWEEREFQEEHQEFQEFRFPRSALGDYQCVTAKEEQGQDVSQFPQGDPFPDQWERKKTDAVGRQGRGN